jgi:chemotaxis methyl-accepting protein methylase
LILSFGIRRREQINLLVNTLTTNYTFFMREPSITSF